VTSAGGFRAALWGGGFGVGAASLGSLERGGDGECRVDLGDGRPDGGGVLPVALAEVFVRLLGEFLGLTVVSWAIHRRSSCLVARYWCDITGHLTGCPGGPRGRRAGRAMGVVTGLAALEPDPRAPGADVLLDAALQAATGLQRVATTYV